MECWAIPLPGSPGGTGKTTLGGGASVSDRPIFGTFGAVKSGRTLLNHLAPLCSTKLPACPDVTRKPTMIEQSIEMRTLVERIALNFMPVASLTRSYSLLNSEIDAVH